MFLSIPLAICRRGSGDTHENRVHKAARRHELTMDAEISYFEIPLCTDRETGKIEMVPWPFLLPSDLAPRFCNWHFFFSKLYARNMCWNHMKGSQSPNPFCIDHRVLKSMILAPPKKNVCSQSDRNMGRQQLPGTENDWRWLPETTYRELERIGRLLEPATQRLSWASSTWARKSICSIDHLRYLFEQYTYPVFCTGYVRMDLGI